MCVRIVWNDHTDTFSAKLKNVEIQNGSVVFRKELLNDCKIQKTSLNGLLEKYYTCLIKFYYIIVEENAVKIHFKVKDVSLKE